MKKLFAALLLSLFLIASCQESSSIVAPTDNSNDNDIQYAPAMEDTSGSYDGHGRPGLPRV